MKNNKTIWCRKKNAKGEWEYIKTDVLHAYHLCIHEGYEINCENPLTKKYDK